MSTAEDISESAREKDGILVVDDTQLMIDLVRKILEDDGYEIFEAQDAAAAKKIFEDHESIKLVLSDINLGVGENGFEILTKILPEKSKRPFRFCFMTSSNDENIRQVAMRFGADDLIKKPVSPRKLRELVSQLLGEPDEQSLEEDHIRIRVEDTNAEMIANPVKPNMKIREITRYTMLLEVSGQIQIDYHFKIYSPKLARLIGSKDPYFSLKTTNSIQIGAARKKAKQEEKKFRYEDGDDHHYLIRCHILELNPAASSGIDSLYRDLQQKKRLSTKV